MSRGVDGCELVRLSVWSILAYESDEGHVQFFLPGPIVSTFDPAPTLSSCSDPHLTHTLSPPSLSPSIYPHVLLAYRNMFISCSFQCRTSRRLCSESALLTL